MDNIVEEKSFRFAVRIVRLYKYLCANKNERTMAQQLLRAGTSIGANVAESEHAQSRADFTSKLNIALKEAAEADYWIRLLYETDYLNQKEYQSVITDCREIESLLASIVKSLRQ